jgi:2-keto-4-pentenoate hydratase/2-oxohepta-3-ene-1,7-dioic acid hydratase in catechol pathway
MALQISEILSYLKQRFPIQPGDWILTGTPEGVAAMKEGDLVTASASDLNGVILSEGGWTVEVDPESGNEDSWKL